MTADTKSVVTLNKERVGELVQNATMASAHLKQGIKELKIHPWKLLFKPSEAEQRELNLFNVAREFAEASYYLDDAAVRLKALLEAQEGLIPATDPDLIDIRSDLAASIDRFSAAEQALWRALSIE